MLDITFSKLAACRTQDLLASEIRLVEQECQRVLKLVTEAEGAARLIEGRARRGCGTPAPDRATSY